MKYYTGNLLLSLSVIFPMMSGLPRRGVQMHPLHPPGPSLQAGNGVSGRWWNESRTLTLSEGVITTVNHEGPWGPARFMFHLYFFLSSLWPVPWLSQLVGWFRIVSNFFFWNAFPGMSESHWCNCTVFLFFFLREMNVILLCHFSELRDLKKN